ncbi:hypothetical protein CLF_112156 [Clonorchis sinensis]|uniref:Uncharacterized protein n=1 Tax=Clonorchis sinensis TaxID=79923 RepID=G7YVW9_CLOSI|nr:hypothetical protein CLF_112156 [Clonorchis sinensis]
MARNHRPEDLVIQTVPQSTYNHELLNFSDFISHPPSRGAIVLPIAHRRAGTKYLLMSKKSPTLSSQGEINLNVGARGITQRQRDPFATATEFLFPTTGTNALRGHCSMHAVQAPGDSDSPKKFHQLTLEHPGPAPITTVTPDRQDPKTPEEESVRRSITPKSNPRPNRLQRPTSPSRTWFVRTRAADQPRPPRTLIGRKYVLAFSTVGLPVSICEDSLANRNYNNNPKRLTQDVHVRGCTRTQVQRCDDVITPAMSAQSKHEAAVRDPYGKEFSMVAAGLLPNKAKEFVTAMNFGTTLSYRARLPKLGNCMNCEVTIVVDGPHYLVCISSLWIIHRQEIIAGGVDDSNQGVHTGHYRSAKLDITSEWDEVIKARNPVELKRIPETENWIDRTLRLYRYNQ